MAALDKNLKQRIVGALVLVALAVIFLPMLFSRPDDLRQVVVDAPAIPKTPEMQPVTQEPVIVPEAEPLPDEPQIEETATISATPEVVSPATVDSPVAVPPVSRLDANSLPVTWSVQLASLATRASAEELQQKLRSKGYNAYVRTFEDKNRVLVGPVVDRAAAEKLRDLLGHQMNLKGFIVRFVPEPL